jgi:arginase
MTRKLAVLDAPRHLGKRPKPGTPVDAHWLSYEQRQRDLVARLHARDAGLVEAPGCRCGEPAARSARSGPHGRGDTRVGFQSFTEALARRTREIVGGREFPVVLGGDCSILLGNMLALRGLGRYGLVFVDGRDEFSYAPGQQRHCGYFAAAGLDLALATGNGPDSLSNLNGLRPYVDERNVVLFGMVRDPGEAMLGDVAPDAAPIQQFHIERIREVGARAAASEALRYLEAQKVDGFWIHVDGDVLDRAAEPDEDDEDTGPGGLEFDELSDALRVFLSSERAAGLEMTIYDPELDPEGVYGEQLVDSVVRAFDAATM